MNSREEFEKWLSDIAADGVDVGMLIEKSAPLIAAWHGWSARQPEIDALKADTEQAVALLKVFMYSEVQSQIELAAGKELIKKYAEMKEPK